MPTSVNRREFLTRVAVGAAVLGASPPGRVLAQSPTDCVSRGSIIGGSQAEARVRVPPRFAGFVLAAIHSGYAPAG